MAVGHGLRVLAVGVVALGAAAGLSWYGLQQQKLATAAANDLTLYEAAETRTALTVNSRTTVADGDVDRGTVVGRLAPARQLLVPHDLADGSKGYDLWMALEYTPGISGINSAGEFVIVNRGWIAEADVSDPAKFQVPDSESEFAGFWVSVPLASEQEVSREFCLDPAWPKKLAHPHPSLGDMKCLFNSQQIAQGLMLLTTDLGEGVTRDWVGQRRAVLQRYKMMVYGAFGGAGVAVLLWLGFALFGRPRAAPAPAPAAAAPAAAATPAEGEAGHHPKPHHPHAPLGKIQR